MQLQVSERSQSVPHYQKPRVVFKPQEFWKQTETDAVYFFDIEDRISKFLEEQEVVFCCSDDFKTHLKSGHKPAASLNLGSSLLLRRRVDRIKSGL